MPTRSPIPKRHVFSPCLSTMPTTWWPGITGDLRGGNSPSITCKSVLHTPHARTRTSTSPLFGCGAATSAYFSGFVSIAAGARNKHAFIAPPRRCPSASNAKQSSAFYLRREILYTRIREPSKSFMFTGIIEHTGAIEALDLKDDGGRVTIHAPSVAPSLAVSNSIAVNGCCLTVVALHDYRLASDLSAETIHKTSFGATGGQLKKGARVNLEQPLTAGN